MELMEGIRILTDEKRMITGLSGAVGNTTASESFVYGNIGEVILKDGAFRPKPVPAKEDSVYDLASLTKLFTAISVLQLEERGKLKLTEELSVHARQFPYLSGLRVGELLTFQKNIETESRVDAQPDRAAALSVLTAARPAPRPERRYYTDMGAMVLKYVIEEASGTAYYDYLSENVLKPLTMDRTFSTVPAELLLETENCNYERRVCPDGRLTVDTACPPGTVHDPKARILSPRGEDLQGHAGLFSTVKDLVKLAQGLLQGAILKKETVLEMGRNRTGFPLPDGTYTHFLGCLCYSKHPVQTYSEVPSFFGERTIALNGFSGNHFSVDPEQKRFLILLSNRVHNRVTVLTGRADPKNREERFLWTDGVEYPVSQNYVYYKDEYLKNPAGEIFRERF